MASTASAGFYGKLPSRGDFVSRRLPTDFVTCWDQWLQAGLATSQAELGDNWLKVYLTSPVWRFVIAPGLVDAQAYAGVMVPSVDRVGRYFPLTAVVPCAQHGSLFEIAGALGAWFDASENLLVETLTDDALSFEAFDDRLAALPVAEFASAAAPPWRLGQTSTRWHCADPDALDLNRAAHTLLSSVLENELAAFCIWWTQGSELMDACLAVSSELPAAGAYTAMLDGRWSACGWASGDVLRPVPSVAPPSDLSVRSSGISDTGSERRINEDSFACEDAARIWLVADGLGGHQAGDTASGMVASVTPLLRPETSLDMRVEVFVSSMQVVNACLQVLAQTNSEIGLAGSTVAALLVEGELCACVWAGDSRIYRLRGGRVEQLSTDHSEQEEAPFGAFDEAIDRHVITRAIGGAPRLELDVTRDRVCAGDRFLLCTDGLYSQLSTGDIARALSLPEPEQGCEELQRVALSGRTPDNLTAVIVHVDRRVDRGIEGALRE